MGSGLPHERPELEPFVWQAYRALFASIAMIAREGLDVVSDVGLHDDYSRPLGILADAVRRLDGLPVCFVGVRCPIEAIMARRNADPQGGYYASGAEVPPPVLRWQQAIHVPGVYDLEIDSSTMTAEACAATIETTLQVEPRPSAFERLATGWAAA